MVSTKPQHTLRAVIGSVVLTAAASWAPPAAAQSDDPPFIGSIRYFGFNFAPRGWAACDGQLLAVSQNDALFSLLGTTYGGDGRTTFGLPDMRGRMPVHQGTGPGLTNRSLGAKGGAASVVLNASQIGHSHTLQGNTGAGNQSTPEGHALAKDSNDDTYRNEAPNVAMQADSIGATGSNQGHNNQSPFLGVHCNIALIGVYPSRS